MRHIFAFAAALIFSAAFSVPLAFAQTSNLIANPSVETANGSAPQSWSSSVWGTTKATFTYPSSGAHSGSRFVQTQVTAAGSGDAKWFPASVPVTPGASYSFSEWYKSTVSTEIDFEYTLASGSKTYKMVSVLPASANWQQFQTTFTAPANAASLKIYHLVEAAGTLGVDDYSLGTAGSTTPPVQKPVITSFTASPSIVQQGQSATLAWNVSNASTLSINQGIGSVSGTSKTVSPNATTTYTLSAANSAGTTTATVTVNVAIPQTPPPPAPISLSPLSLMPGTTTAQYSQQLTASTSASGSFAWSVASGALPPGLSLGNSTGLSNSITGTPSAAGNFAFSIKVTNGTSSTTNSYAIVVAQAAATSTQGSNLIQNGDFETANGSSPLSWTKGGWGTNTAVYTYPVAGNGGGKAAQVQITSYTDGDAKWVASAFAASSHTIYRYKEDYKSNVTTNVTVEYKKSDGSFLYEWLGDLPATPNWTVYSADITVPAGVVSFKLLHSLVSVGTLALDNVDVEAQANDAFAQGMVSLIFDDGLSTQYKKALPILNAAGYKGGFYIITTEPDSGDTDYMTWTQIKALASAGQEIGSHTRTHPYLTTLDPTELQSEVAGAKADLAAQGINTNMFVYPYGDVDSTVESGVAGAGYTAARGSDFGLNSALSDPLNLYDIRLDSSSNLATIEAYIDQALADKRWLIFEIHDVVAGGDSYSITPSFFQSVVNYLKQKNASVVTLSQGASQLSH